jgi:hypothetical protein
LKIKPRKLIIIHIVQFISISETYVKYSMAWKCLIIKM